MTNSRFWLVIPAAGIGQRMQADCPKQYLRLNGRFLLDITITGLLQSSRFAGCVVAIHPDDALWLQTEASRNSEVSTCYGGAERADSVMAALMQLGDRAAPDDWVLVHDVARPCLAASDLDKLMESLADHPVGGLLATPVTDTIKRTRQDSFDVETTVDRSCLWRALTPQMFRYRILVEALEKAAEGGMAVTDEASAIEYAGLNPRIVEGRPDNIKVTLPADLALAEFILNRLECGE